MKTWSPGRVSTLLSPLDQRFVLNRYAIALGMAILAILLRWLLEPVLGHSGFYVTLYMAVVFTALLCSLGPSILTSAMGFLGIVYWFVDPRYTLAVARRSDIHDIIGCVLVCTVLVTLGETNRRKQLKLNESRDNLAGCGKTLFETLEQRGLAVLLVTKTLDSHRLTPCAAAHLMPSASPSAAQRYIQ